MPAMQRASGNRSRLLPVTLHRLLAGAQRSEHCPHGPPAEGKRKMRRLRRFLLPSEDAKPRLASSVLAGHPWHPLTMNGTRTKRNGIQSQLKGLFGVSII